MSGVNKYIDIDSTYRNVAKYPSSGDFVATMNDTLPPGGTTAFNAKSPVSLSFPYDTGILAVNATVTPFLIYTTNYYFLTMQLSASARQQANFYVGSYINFPYARPTVVGGQLYGTPNKAYWYIVGYISLTQTIYCIPYTRIVPTTDVYTLTYTPFYLATILPNYGPGYFIRYELPISFAPGVYDDTIAAAANTTTVVQAGPLSSNISGSYVGFYFFVPPASIPIYPFYKGANPFFFNYQFPIIKSYTSVLGVNTITLASALLTVYPAVGIPFGGLFAASINGVYEICPFSYDQYAPLQYLGTENFSNPRCCNITLTNVILPANLPLQNTNGGTLTDIPFLWVELSSEKGNTYQQQIISANKASKVALFKCSISPNYSASTTIYGYPVSAYPFLNLCPLMGNQTVNFRLNDDMRFRVLLPNGEPLNFNVTYFEFFNGSFTYFPGLGFPVPPDPRMQIQATFNVQFSNK